MDMIEAILVTSVVLVGLLVLNLVLQVLHQVRMTKVLNRLVKLEDRILARLLMEDQIEAELQGEPVTLEDLILRDMLEKDPDLYTPATNEDMLKILKEIQYPIQTDR